MSSETTGFPIRIPTLSRAEVGRDEDLRDPARIAAAWPSARVLVVDDRGRVVVTGEPPVLSTLPSSGFGARPPADAVLLGRTAATPHDVWAVTGTHPDGAELTDLREVGERLGDADAGLLTSAVAVLQWHARGRFCPRCGQASTVTGAGWSRRCPDGHEEWPRTDPAVIVLVHDGAGRTVLARQPVWPTGRFSVLAGFVEAGESLEATVRREMAEEVGVVIDDVAYLGSQPWPFPRSLMVGFAATVAAGAPLRPQDGEIEDARWVDRATVRRILAAGGEAEGIALPGPVSIARAMIEGWAAVDGPDGS